MPVIRRGNIGRIGFLLAEKVLKFSWSGKAEWLSSPVTLLSRDRKANPQPHVLPFGGINAILESVSNGICSPHNLPAPTALFADRWHLGGRRDGDNPDWISAPHHEVAIPAGANCQPWWQC